MQILHLDIIVLVLSVNLAKHSAELQFDLPPQQSQTNFHQQLHSSLWQQRAEIYQ